MPENPYETRLIELLKKAMERQRIGAQEALDELISSHVVGGDVEATYQRPQNVRWVEPDDAEMALRRFLRDYPI